MRVVIFLWQPDDTVVRELGAYDLVIAADSGLHSATRWGVTADTVVGDFDSVDAAQLEGITDVRRFPTEKDATDFELAIETAIEAKADAITVVGSMQGRVDHALSVMLALAAPHLSEISVDAFIDTSYVQVVRSSTQFLKANGKTVSLIPVHGEAAGVSTDGLRYQLTDATLGKGSTLPISNEISNETAKVSVSSGFLLAIQSDVCHD